MSKNAGRDTRKLVDDWLEMAYDAIEVAHLCYAHKHFLFAAHTCQQGIEKALKAALQNDGIVPPHTHNLDKLAQKCGIWGLLTIEQQKFLVLLSGLYISAKYPNVKAAKSRNLTEKTIERFLGDSREVLSLICRHVRKL